MKVIRFTIRFYYIRNTSSVHSAASLTTSTTIEFKQNFDDCPPEILKHSIS